MATTLETVLTFILSGSYNKDYDLQDTKNNLKLNKGDTLATGTSANQADLMWHDTRTLTATSEDLDLAGSLTDAFGDTLTLVKVKMILIHNKSTTATETLAVGGAAANQFVNWIGNSSDIVNIGPDGLLLLWSPVDGYAVTAATGDLLKIDSGSDTITYDIVVIGTSA